MSVMGFQKKCWMGVCGWGELYPSFFLNFWNFFNFAKPLSLDTIYINKCNFCYPFLSLLGVLSGIMATLRLLPLVIPYSGTLRYDMTLVLVLLFYTNTCQFCYHFLLSLLWLRSGVKPSLGFVHWSVRTRRRLSYMSVILTLVILHK